MSTPFSGLIRDRRLLPAVALLGLLALPAAGSSEPGEPEPQGLTLQKALALAFEQNRDIQKALEYRNYVEGKYVEERGAALPQLIIQGSGLRQHDESTKALFAGLYPDQQDVLSGQIGLSQALFTWGQVSSAIRAARHGRAVAEDQLRFYRQGVSRDVSASFHNVLLAKELASLAEVNLELKLRHADEARRKNEAGTATDYDVLAAEVSAENARPELIRARNLVRLARDHLGFLLAVKEDPVDAVGSLSCEIAPYPEYREALDRARQHRPELAEIDHRRKVVAEVVRIANAGDKPRLDFQGSYGWKQIRLEQLDTDGQTWQAGLFLTFPVFDGLRSRGRVAQARSNFTTLQIEEARLLDGISLEVHKAVDAVREAAEIVKAISGTVAQAERLLFMAEKGYELGVKTHLDVEDAQFNLIQAKGSLARARRDYLVSGVTLEWVQGTLAEAPPAGP